MMIKKKYYSALTILCLSLSCLAWGHSAYIYGKALLAQYLIADAWYITLQNQQNSKPWPWADTWPVGALQLPHSNKTLYVLAGASGTSLAFGPGHIDASAAIESKETKVISGHRDTHFKALAEVTIGDTVRLQDKYGQWQNYIIREEHIVDIRDGNWHITPDVNALHLITCYPFDATLPGGPMRYIAIATPEMVETKATESKIVSQRELNTQAMQF